MLALLLASPSTATRPNTVHPDPCHGQSVTAKEFREFAEKTWRLPAWERGAPKARTIAAQRRALRCAAGPGHRHAIRAIWRRDKVAFYKHRAAMIRRAHATPYWGCTSLGGCRFWSLPAYIVDCESGGDFTPDAGLTFGGAYGLLVSTWQQFGGLRWASQANYAPPYAQDIVAHRAWIAVGPSGWACA